MVVTGEQMLLQVRYAFMLMFLGATDLASKHFSAVEKVNSIRGLRLEEKLPEYHQYFALYYLSHYEYEKAATKFSKTILKEREI